MYNQAIVLEIIKEYAIVIDEGGKVHRIKKKKNMSVGDKIYYLEEDRYNVLAAPEKRKFPYMKYLAVAAVFLLLFTGVFSNLMKNQTYAAMAMGTASHPLTMEFREDGRIRSINDPYGQLKESNFKGKTIEEVLPLLINYANSLGIEDLVISSTYPPEEFEKIRNLIASLQKGTNKVGVLLMESTLEDYEKSVAEGNSLSAYLIRERLIPLWSDEDALLFTPERKREIIGDRGKYFQTDEDVKRREEIRLEEERKAAEEKARQEAEEQKAREEQEAREAQQRQAQPQQRQSTPAPRPQQTQPRRQTPVRRTPVYNDDDDDDDWDDDDWDDDD